MSIGFRQKPPGRTLRQLRLLWVRVDSRAGALDLCRGLCSAPCMGESQAPSSAFCRATELTPATLELGSLKNGLGSIQNLELVLKSIRVGHKGLLAAVAAVHADCGPMIASARALLGPLTDLGGDASCARRLADLFIEALTELESVLSAAVRAGRLSVGQRLKLEGDLARARRELCAGLRLVGLLERAARPRPAEPTPVALVHADTVERTEEAAVRVQLALPASCSAAGLGVDLDAARLLLSLGVALVLEGQPEQMAEVSFALAASGDAVTRISAGSGAGQGKPIRLASLGLVGPSLACAEVASRRLGGRFEFSPLARRVCIYWPLS